MKAAVIYECGGADKIQGQQRPDPEPQPGEVVVQVKAAALNHLDVWVLAGGRGSGLTFPHILGSDAAGVVAAIGPGAGDVDEGDEVVVSPGLNPKVDEFVLAGRQPRHSPYREKPEVLSLRHSYISVDRSPVDGRMHGA